MKVVSREDVLEAIEYLKENLYPAETLESVVGRFKARLEMILYKKEKERRKFE